MNRLLNERMNIETMRVGGPASTNEIRKLASTNEMRNFQLTLVSPVSLVGYQYSLQSIYI